MLVATNKRNDTLKKFEELWNKIRYLVRSKTNKSENFEENIWKSNSIQMTIYL